MDGTLMATHAHVRVAGVDVAATMWHAARQRKRSLLIAAPVSCNGLFCGRHVHIGGQRSVTSPSWLSVLFSRV
jgi:hypothetical protein